MAIIHYENNTVSISNACAEYKSKEKGNEFRSTPT
jgi:hypothetical protein